MVAIDLNIKSCLIMENAYKSSMLVEQKLVLAGKRVKSILAYDLPLHLLDPQLSSGDTVMFAFEDEPTLPQQ